MRLSLTEKQRGWVYRVMLAALPLLVAYGILDEQTAPLWAALALAFTSSGLAAKHTSIKPATEPEPDLP